MDLENHPETESTAQEAAPAGHLWLFWLLFRPGRFFRHFAAEPMAILMVFSCYVFGLASAIDRLETRMIRAEMQGRDTWSFVATSWPTYWGIAIVGGMISAVMLYFLGGWWYRKRIEMCGDAKPDTGLGRRVYVLASLVWAIPSVVYTIWETGEYETPRSAAQGDDMVGVLLILFAFWSVVTSYRGVTACFVLRRGKALLWFLILPGLLYVVAFSALLIAIFAGVFIAKPDIERPATHGGSVFSVQYPGNWILDTTIEGYDPDDHVAFRPPYADSVTFVTMSTTAVAADAAQQTCDYLQEIFGVDRWRPVDNWWFDVEDGSERVGFTAIVTIDGGRYVGEVIAKARGERCVVCWSVSEQSIAEDLRTGRTLIYESFRFR